MQPQHDLIVIGGSAGSLPALQTLLGNLPPELPVAILVVVHSSPDNPGGLVDILNRRSVYRVSYARDREKTRTGMCMWHPRISISRLSTAVCR